MKDKIRNFLEGIRNINLKKRFLDVMIVRKKEIIKVVIFILLLVLISFLIEYFGFGRNFNQYRFLFILVILSLGSFFFVYRKKIGEKPEIGFLAVALICGSLLAVSEPKNYVSWDEQIHFKRAEKLANSVVGGYSRPNKVENSYSYEEQKIISEGIEKRYKKALTKSSGESLSYNELGYIPSVIALILGKIAQMPYVAIFVFGRVFNVFAYSLIVFFAIKKLKSGKMIMSIVALFPTSIFLAANYGYDQWVTAFTLLGLAYLFSELQQPEKKMSTKEMMIMLGAFVVGMGPKAIYFPLMLLLFLLKPLKFENIKQYRKFMWASALAVLFVVGSFMLPFVIGGPGGGDKRGGSAVNAAEQVKFVLTQPVEYAKILSNFMLDYIDPRNASGFVSFFAYMGMTETFSLVMLILVVVVFTDKNKYDEKTTTWKVRICVMAVYLMTVALICSALYVSFTAVKSATIGGVQPRYLIPLVFPLLFVIGSSKIKNPFNKNAYNSFVFVVMAFVLLQGTWNLIIRNYY